LSFYLLTINIITVYLCHNNLYQLYETPKIYYVFDLFVAKIKRDKQL